MSGEEVKILFALCSTLAISKDTYSDRKAHLSMGSIRLDTGLERKKPSEKKGARVHEDKKEKHKM